MNRFVLRRMVELDARARSAEARGDDRAALACWEEVCQLVTEPLGEDHLWRLARIVDLAASCRRLGDVDRAERLFLDVIHQLDLRADANDAPVRSELARGLNSLGVLYCDSARPTEAIDVLDRALRLSGDSGSEKQGAARGAILSNLSKAHQAMGQWERAMACIEEALALYRQAGDSALLEQVDCLCSLAELSVDARRLIDSADYARRAMALLDRMTKRDPCAAVRFLIRLAETFYRLGEEGLAIRLLERAVESLDSADARSVPEFGHCLDAMSTIRSRQRSRVGDEG